MKASLLTIVLAATAQADDLIRFSGGFQVNDQYVTVCNDQYFWDAGSAISMGDGLWVGEGWQTFPGGEGALTGIMLQEDRWIPHDPMVEYAPYGSESAYYPSPVSFVADDFWGFDTTY